MLTHSLATFVTDTAADTLPPSVLATAGDAITDTVGVTLAGVQEQTAAIARRWATASGAPTIHLLGTNEESSIAEAAFANGVAAHALDFDDSMPSLRGHPSATLVPVVLTVGESERAGGRDVLAAYAVALEIGGKLGRAIGQQHYLKGWHSTATIGAFTATAAAARLWRLSADELAVAWGIAASMSGGLVRNFGTMTKPFHTGHAARVGINAAWMAREGFTADPEIFDGADGFLGVYGFGDGEDLAGIVGELGTVWEAERPGIFVKGWPCCYCSHRPIGGLFQLMDEHEFAADDVEEIAVGFAPGSDRALIKDNPQTGLEAKFSIEYAAAATVLDRTLTLDSFTDEAVARPAVRSLMRRVRRYQVPADGVFSGLTGFTDIAVKAGGESFERHVDRVPGSPDWPLSRDDRRSKFLACASRTLGGDGAESLLTLAGALADLTDIGELTRATRPAGGSA